jgi:chorismate synthase
MLRFLTAGESHGICLSGILEGLPSGLPVDEAFINLQLQRRQLGYGRGGRMKIETDRIQITSGVRHGRTLGSPISFTIQNRDWPNWQTAMSVEPVPEGSEIRSVALPRPGHADLPGAIKFDTHDVRNVLERASARETATRVAVGALCRLFLGRFGIKVASHTVAIGGEFIAAEYEAAESERIFGLDTLSQLRCLDPHAEKRMLAAIDAARDAGDTLGGIAEIVAGPVPPGLGSHIQWDRRLDGQIAQAMMSIPSVKAVEIGSGLLNAQRKGSEVHDEIFYDDENRRFRRHTNNAGGVEGGISNGEEIRIKIHLKPIPTLMNAMRSADVLTKQESRAVVERSDVCVVPAGGVVGEAMLAMVLASAFLEKFGGDSMRETENNYAHFCGMMEEY